ncbi:MAG: isoprenylcysteine carboxylmethyltransferase family protein [Haliea sp.]
MTEPTPTPDETPRAEQDHAQVKFPPPLIFVLLILLSLGLDYLWPLGMGIPETFQPIGIAVTLFGVTVVILINSQFKHNSTAIEPWKPTTTLITHGFYRWSRNPIYLGFCLFNIGIGVAMNSLWIVLSFLPGAILVYYIAIAREEKYLERRFGEEYLAYKRQVRRWL